MTTDRNNIYESRIVAPRLRALQGNPWGWVAVNDLIEVLNQDANTVWFQYCHEARKATQAEDWNGKSWTVALPEGDGYSIKDVWDNRTGNLINIANCAPEDLLVPAGWYKTRNKVADQLDEALRAVFRYASNHRHLSIHNVDHCHVMEKESEPAIVKALTAIGTVAQLEWSLTRIISHPRGLEMTRRDDTNQNIIHLRFKNRAESESMSVCFWIRLVIGEIKLQQFSVSDM